MTLHAHFEPALHERIDGWVDGWMDKLDGDLALGCHVSSVHQKRHHVPQLICTTVPLCQTVFHIQPCTSYSVPASEMQPKCSLDPAPVAPGWCQRCHVAAPVGLRPGLGADAGAQNPATCTLAPEACLLTIPDFNKSMCCTKVRVPPSRVWSSPVLLTALLSICFEQELQYQAQHTRKITKPFPPKYA